MQFIAAEVECRTIPDMQNLEPTLLQVQMRVRIQRRPLMEFLGFDYMTGFIWKAGFSLSFSDFLMNNNTSRAKTEIRTAPSRNPQLIFHEFPAFPIWIPKTIFKAPKNRAILPTQWWYQFQYFRVLASWFGRRKNAIT